MKSVLLTAAALLVACGSVGAQPQRSILNPGFEEPFLVPPAAAENNDFFRNPGQVIQADENWVVGWQTNHPDQTSACPGLSPCNPIEMWHEVFESVPAAEGAIFIELNAFQLSRAYQEICITSGEQFAWTFNHRARGSGGGADVARFVIGGAALGSGTEIVRVSTPRSGAVGTVESGTGTATSAGSGWTRYDGSYSYSGATGVQQLGFEAVSSASGSPGSGNFLDGIQIELTPYVEFTSATYRDDEDNPTDIPALRVSGNLTAPLPVTLQVGGTATEGQDFTLTNPVVIPAGNYDGSTPIPLDLELLEDFGSEADETIDLQLQAGGTAYTVASTVGCGTAANGSATYTVANDDTAPGGVAAGLRLWLDAADTRTILGDAACTQPAATDGHDVACWRDKSTFRSDVVAVGGSNGVPTWRANQFNGRPALEFSTSERDTLRHVLAAPWTADYTEFVVFEQVGAPQEYDSFFSNGPDSSGPYHQITHLGGDFQWFHGATRLSIEAFSNELKLYAVRSSATGTEVFADGAPRGSDPENGGRTFAQYRINQNREGERLNNSKIAEVIVYDRALGNCEVEEIALSLGRKYGRDFFDLGAGWDFAPAYDTDVNGIASFSTSFCGTARQIDTAASGEVTIDEPTGLDVGEKLLIAHDGATGSVRSTSGAFDTRLARIWRVDADEPPAPGIAVRVTFDISQTAFPRQADRLELLVWRAGSDPATDPAATVLPVAALAGELVRFENVAFEDGDFFTLGHAAPDGILVQNADTVAYPSLGAPIAPAPDLRVAFPFSAATTIDEARVDISANYQRGADVLAVGSSAATSGTLLGLAWQWDAVAGVLSFSGTADPATYEAALRQVTFRNTSGSPSTAQRQITYSLGSGLRFPDNGHFYDFVPQAGISQADAVAAAGASTYFGLQGYLTTVTSQPETEFIIDKLGGRGGWIGASDAAVADSWRWVTGPEGLEDGGQGRLFYRNGNAVGGAYANWNPGEPNGSGDVAYFIKIGSPWGGEAGKWDDIPDTPGAAGSNIDGYVVEYGGLPGDPVVSLADVARVDIVEPTLALTVSASPDPVDGGADTTVTVAWENTGPAPAIDAVLHATVPPGATFVSATAGGGLAGRTVTWDLGALASGGTGSVAFVLTMPTAAGDLAVTANISADNVATPVTGGTSVSVLGPTLTLSKTGPAVVGAGEDITYTLRYGNTGSGTAFAAVLSDELPAGFTFVSGSPAPTVSGATVRWDLPDIPPAGTGTVTLTLAAPGAEQSATNTATLTAASTTGVQASLNTRVSECDAPAAACLTKTFTPATIEAGGSADLTFRIENGLDDQDRTVTFTDSLPAGLELAAAPASPQCGATIGGGAGGGAVTVTNAAVGPATVEDCTITVPVTAPAGGSFVNDTSRIGNATGVDPTGLSATLIVTEPQLSITKTATPASALVGSTITWLITVRNGGTAAARDLTVVDTLPAQAAFAAASQGGQQAGSQVTWDAGTLAAGASATFTVTATAPGAPATLTSEAIASAGNAASVAASATVDVFGEPAFAVTVTDAPDPVDDGEAIDYTIAVTNTGTVGAIDSTVALPVPAGTTFVSASGSGALAGDVVEWNLGAIPVGVTLSVSATVLTDLFLADQTVIAAQATAAAVNLAAPVSASAETTVNSEPLLAVTLTVDPPVVRGGEGAAYEIAFANNGTDVASDAVLTFTAPASTQLVTATGSGAIVGDVVTWTLGALRPGEAGSYAVTLRADTGVPSGTSLTATASLSAATRCGDPGAPCAATARAVLPVDSAPVLELRQDVPAYGVPGATLTYAIEYFNRGNLDAEDRIVVDRLPVGTTFVAATSGGVCEDGQTPPGPCVGPSDGSQTVRWGVGTIPLNSGGSLGLTVRVPEPLADGTPLVNNAELLGAAPGGPAAVVSLAETTIVSSPVLTLQQAVQPTVAAGGELLYTLRIDNVGTDDATALVLESRLPENVSFRSASSGGTLETDRVVWLLDRLGAQETRSVSLLVAVDAPLPDGTLLANSATIDSFETGGVTSQALTRVLSAPVPTLIQTAQPARVVAAGESVTFTLDFANRGSDAMQGAVLSDHVPNGLVPSTIGGGGTFDAATGTITWDLGTFPPGASGSHSYTLPVPLDTPQGTELLSSATFEADNAAAATDLNRVAVTSLPLLALTNRAPARSRAGEPLVYELRYENLGNATARNVVLEGTLPPETSFVSATGSPARSGQRVRWTLGALRPGQSGSVLVRALALIPLADGTGLVNQATLAASNATPVGDIAFTLISSAPALELAKIGPARASALDRITYDLLYENRGTTGATDVVITDQLPADVAFVGATDGGTELDGRVRWDIGDLPAGAAGSVSVTVDIANPIADGTVLANQATLAASDGGPASARALTTVTSGPVYALEKRAAAALVDSGGQVRFELAYRNEGTAGGTGAVLTDLLPPGATFVSASGAGIFDAASGTVTWDLGTLAPGESGTETVTLAVPAGTQDGTILANTATLVGDAAPPASATELVVVRAEPGLSLGVTTDRSLAVPGDTLRFTVTYANSGSAPATGLELDQILPRGLVFLAASDGGTFDDGSRVVRWSLPDLAPGAAGQVTVDALVSVTSPLPDGSRAATTLELADADGRSVPGQASVSISAPVLVTTNSAGPDPVAPGEILTFTVAYENRGSASATASFAALSIGPALEVTDVSGGGSYDPERRTAVWTLGTIPPGGGGQVSLSGRVASPLADGVFIESVALVTAAEFVPAPSGVAARAVVSSQPVLVLGKTGPSTASEGETIDFLLRVQNIGPAVAGPVTVVDELPPGLAFLAASPGGAFDQSTNTVTWHLADLAPGDARDLTLTVRVDELVGTVVNRASASAPGLPLVTAQATVGDGSAALLGLAKTGPRFADPGVPFVFEIEVENAGAVTVDAVVVEDPLPEGLQFLAADEGGSFDPLTGAVSWALPSLEPRATRRLRVLVLAPSPTQPIENTARARGAGVDTVTASAIVLPGGLLFRDGFEPFLLFRDGFESFLDRLRGAP